MDSTFSSDIAQDQHPATNNGSSAETNNTTTKASVRTIVRNKKLFWRVALVVGFCVLAVIVAKIVLTKTHTPAVQGVSTTNPSNQLSINKAFTFQARTADQKLVDGKAIRMTIVDAYVNKTILINGQPATARDNKTFLLLDITLDNPYADPYYMPVNNLIRLQQDGKFYAPDVHNGLVLIDPISTKTTRIGFLVSDSLHNFTLKVGEISGDKQTIDLKL